MVENTVVGTSSSLPGVLLIRGTLVVLGAPTRHPLGPVERMCVHHDLPSRFDNFRTQRLSMPQPQLRELVVAVAIVRSPI